MHEIIKATEKDVALVSTLATNTFLQSHGHSAPAADINNYIAAKYNEAILKEELNDPQNIYHIIYCDEKPAGYSKIVYNQPYENSVQQNITKLERIYILQEFYNVQLGKALFRFNVALAKQNQQAGMWLYVWKERYDGAAPTRSSGASRRHILCRGSNKYKRLLYRSSSNGNWY